MDKLPDDILKAYKLFSDFEKLSLKMRVQKFEKTFFEAIKLLDNHIKENPYSPHIEQISNMKESNIRSLLEHINELKFDTHEKWFWAKTCLKMGGDEILTLIFKGYPEFKRKLGYPQQLEGLSPNMVKLLGCTKCKTIFLSV